jgi:hypothetical protein
LIRLADGAASRDDSAVIAALSTAMIGDQTVTNSPDAEVQLLCGQRWTM